MPRHSTSRRSPLPCHFVLHRKVCFTRTAERSYPSLVLGPISPADEVFTWPSPLENARAAGPGSRARRRLGFSGRLLGAVAALTVRVVLAPERLGKIESLGHGLPAKPSSRVDGEALPGRMCSRSRVEVGLEETRASFASADRHVREFAGLFRNLHPRIATRPQRAGQARSAGPRGRFSTETGVRASRRRGEPLPLRLTARGSPRSRSGRG
jgi:hypothetical protein